MPALQEAERTVYLVNPESPGVKLVIGGWSVGVPSGLGVVGSMMDREIEKAGFTPKEVNIEFVEEDLGQRANPRAGDLVLISAFSLTSKRAKKITREAVERGAYVIVGGIHATQVPDDFTSEEGISFVGEAGNSVVFRGEAQRWLQTGELERGQIVVSEGQTKPKSINLAGLPVSERVYKMLDKNRFTHATFAISGCPYDCAFCTAMGGGVVKTRPIEEVINEIEVRGLDKMGFTLADSNFGAAGDKYLYGLLEALARLKIPKAWHVEISVNLLDRGGDRLLDALKAAHCHRLIVGYESFNRKSLESVGKSQNFEYVDKGRVREIVRNTHKCGIKQTALLVNGFVEDTVASIRDTEECIKYTELDDVNISLLTPLPGSGIWDEFAAKGYFDPQTLDTDKLDFRHLLFNHPKLPNDVLLQEHQRLCKRVFSFCEVFKRSARAYAMSVRHNVPQDRERQFRNCFGTGFLYALVNRGGRPPRWKF